VSPRIVDRTVTSSQDLNAAVEQYRAGDYRQALALVSRALSFDPTSAEAHCFRGDTYRAIGELEDAVASYRAAISLNPNYSEAFNNLGVTLAAQGRVEDALASFESALACRPGYVDAQINLGNAYLDLGRLQDAIACHEKAMAMNPDFGVACIMLGRAFQLSGRDSEALLKYQEGLAIDPNIAEGHIFLGHMLHEQGMIDDALECFDNAVKLQPDNVRARWASVMSQLALVHDAREGAEDSRGNFSDALATLDEWLDQSRVLDGANTVGMQQPFYLAYHEVNNRKLLSRYGDLCSRLTRSWQESEGIAPLPPLADEKLLRIGIVSGQIRYHSVWSAIVKGWLQHVDVERFAFYIFHTGTGKDAETAYAETRAAYFAQAPKSMQEWVDAIVSQRLDVLIYPEIGMDPPTLKLASMRLVPVQVAAWGHPETSGLPTIDYFLSAEDFEPEIAQDKYRE
jgi:protein O-GlcNAc transferase